MDMRTAARKAGEQFGRGARTASRARDEVKRLRAELQHYNFRDSIRTAEQKFQQNRIPVLAGALVLGVIAGLSIKQGYSHR